MQLRLLLNFTKDANDYSSSVFTSEMDTTPGLETLDNFPDIKRLVLDVLNFRAKVNREVSEMPPESK